MKIFLMRSWTHHEPKRPRGTPGLLSSGHKPPAGMAAVMLHVGNIPVTEDVENAWIMERLPLLKWHTIAQSPPARNPERGEQTILTWDARSATYGLIFFEAMEEPEPTQWVGLTHWCDITALSPEDLPLEERRD